jgi:hypothetical protein
MYNESVKETYIKAIDREVFTFVCKTVNGEIVSPITVGFVSEEMGNAIKELTGLDVVGNRILLTSDAVKHILKRHGELGDADNSMADYNDIARICYVLSNYDDIEYEGLSSRSLLTKKGSPAPHIVIKKRINGFYYVVEAISDGKMHTNTVVSAYKTNRD